MVQTAIFDLYYVFVEVIFKSILASGFGIAIIMMIIGFLTRMSPALIMFLVGAFVVTFAIGYVGALAAIPAFIIALVYFSFSIVQFTRRFI